jgi:putative hemolysin
MLDEILIVFLLVLLNGFFAMSELAIVSAKKARLKRLASEGSSGARTALHLQEDPSRFLATVQFGITLIGVIAGAYSGATLSEPVAEAFEGAGLAKPVASGLAFALVIVLITYLSIILGELVPKRLALARPESLAVFAARPMAFVSWLGTPIVWILRRSTEGVMKVLPEPRQDDDEEEVAEDELKHLIEEGTAKGVFEEAERDLINGVMRLSDIPVKSIMTPRVDIVWFEPNEPVESLQAKLSESGRSRFPVCSGVHFELKGIVYAKDLLKPLLAGEKVDIANYMRPPLAVPENMPVLDLLQTFRESGTHLAVVVSQYGGVEGIVTPTDVLDAVAGRLSPFSADDENDIVTREDGSLLIAGLTQLDEVEQALGQRTLSERGDSDTLAAFLLAELKRVPTVGCVLEVGGFRFEVVDMDGWRIDRVLVSRLPPHEVTGSG